MIELVKATERVALRAGKGEGAILGVVPIGGSVEVFERVEGFVHGRYPAGNPLAVGWGRAEAFEAGGALEMPPLDEALFVRRAFSAAAEFNVPEVNRANPAVPDFLLALALLHGGIKNEMSGPRFGPLGFLEATWQQLCAFAGPPDGFAPLPSEITGGYPQLRAGAVEMHVNGKAIAELHAKGGHGSSAEDPFVPDYLALLHAHLLDTAMALALWLARKDGKTEGSLLALAAKVWNLPEEEARPLLLADLDWFNGTAELPSLAGFLKTSEERLTAALAEAYALLEKHVPEANPPKGVAPWMAEARRLEGLKLSESNDADLIKSFFAATNFGTPGPGAPPHWCGAFVAHCLKTAGGASAASIVSGAAQASRWQTWGDQDLPKLPGSNVPVGAVVVLSPGGDTGTSGHVGFFVRWDGDKVVLLGGNQGNTCKESSYAAGRIVALRWLKAISVGAASGQQAAGTGAVVADLRTDGLSADASVTARLIMQRFAEAGYAPFQQIAAVANAMAESSLDPKKRNVVKNADGTLKEDSVGLFQCNMVGGEGQGKRVEELEDPETNIGIILAKAKRTKFAETATLEAAVDHFVRKVLVPANQDAAVAKRLELAKGFLPQA